MESFSNFMSNKNLDQMAAMLTRHKFPIVEFVEWYEQEGQHLDEAVVEGILGNMAAGGLAGAGLGGYLGPWGTAAGGAVGALGGAAKSAYDYFSKPKDDYNTSKQQAVDALQKFAKFSPRYQKMLNMMTNYVSRIQPSPDAGPMAKRAARAMPGKEKAGPASSWDAGMARLKKQQDDEQFQQAGIDAAKADAAGITYAQYHNTVLKYLNSGMDADDAQKAAKRAMKLETKIANYFWNKFITESTYIP